MSGDLLLGTFGDLGKVQHQIEATLNNNGLSTRCENFAELKNEAAVNEAKEEEEKQSMNNVYEEKPEEESHRSLHTFKKGERAKMLADGYTTGFFILHLRRLRF